MLDWLDVLESLLAELAEDRLVDDRLDALDWLDALLPDEDSEDAELCEVDDGLEEFDDAEDRELADEAEDEPLLRLEALDRLEAELDEDSSSASHSSRASPDPPL